MSNENNLKEIEEKIKNLSSTMTELNQDKKEIVSYIETKTKGGIKKWFRKYIGGGILSLIIMGITIYFSVIAKSTKYITNSITDKFAEPKIEETLKEVAKNQANIILENSLNPTIQEALLSVDQKIGLFDIDLQEFKKQYDQELKMLAQEVEYIKNRNEVLKLSDRASASGDAEAFEKLGNISNSSKDENIRMLALSEIFRIKSQIATMTRIKGIEVRYIDPKTGKEFIEEEIPTEALIKELKEAPFWKHRARIAELLKTRKEKQVPEALLEALRTDKNLEVRKKALDSFESITGFRSPDVIKYKPASEWWKDNKKDIEPKLQDLQTMEEVIEENS